MVSTAVDCRWQVEAYITSLNRRSCWNCILRTVDEVTWPCLLQILRTSCTWRRHWKTHCASWIPLTVVVLCAISDMDYDASQKPSLLLSYLSSVCILTGDIDKGFLTVHASVRLSRYDIVSKRMHIPSNFFHYWYGHYSSSLEPKQHFEILGVTSSVGVVNMGVPLWKICVFDWNRPLCQKRYYIRPRFCRSRTGSRRYPSEPCRLWLPWVMLKGVIPTGIYFFQRSSLHVLVMFVPFYQQQRYSTCKPTWGRIVVLRINHAANQKGIASVLPNFYDPVYYTNTVQPTTNEFGKVT